MDEFVILGATTSALSSQYITLRVKSVDADVLKNKLGGTSGALAAAALPIIRNEPKAVLDLVAPFIGTVAKRYGLDVETTISNAPTVTGKRSVSEFWPGLVLGIGIGGVSIGVIKIVSGLLRR